MTRALLWLLRAYQRWLSPLLGPRCRFLPSCSEYACECLQVHGLGRGTALAARRIARCHPWGGSGFDPVPAPQVVSAPSGAPPAVPPLGASALPGAAAPRAHEAIVRASARASQSPASRLRTGRTAPRGLSGSSTSVQMDRVDG